MRIDELKKIAAENDYEHWELEYLHVFTKKHTNYFICISKNKEKRIWVKTPMMCDDKDFYMTKAAVEFAETPPEDRAEESFLTTKEFIEKVNNLGFNVEIIKDENPFSPMCGKDSILKIWCEEELVAKIWLASTYAINTFNEGHTIYRRGYDLNALYRLCFEYAGTPVDER